jgi:exosome complex component RRP42
MAPQTPTLLSPSELSYLHTSLSLHPPIRPDARTPTSFRPLVAETDLLPSANGSARLCFADGTEAIVGVKGEVERTGDARRNVDIRGEDEEMEGTETEGFGGGRGEESWIEVSIDIPGQREDDAMVVFLAQMIGEGLVADGGLKDRLVINGRWHWRLYIDVRPSHALPFLSFFLPPSTYKMLASMTLMN